MRYDLTDPAYLDDPTQMLARMRAEGPLVRAKLPVLGEVHLTTTDAAARRVLKDSATFARNPERAGGRGYDRMIWWLPRFMRPLTRTMLLHDGAEHRRLRGLVEAAFSRHAMLDLRPRIAAIADGLLDRMDPGATVDLVAAYARPLPLLAICDLLGIPQDDRARVAGWISPVSSPVSVLGTLRALPGFRRLIGYVRAEFAAVRAGGGRPGLIRDLVLAEMDGDRLDEDELLGMVVMLFIAGHETTVHLIANAILAGLEDGRLGPALAREPDRLPLAVEEFMRFFSPVMMTKPLFVTEDTEIDGVALKKGAKVAALLIGANHDPARVEAPHELRPDRRPNPHLGFGHGPHVCLGMQLARAEAEVALARLFARHPAARLAIPRANVARTRRVGLRGLAALPVSLGPAHP